MAKFLISLLILSGVFFSVPVFSVESSSGANSSCRSTLAALMILRQRNGEFSAFIPYDKWKSVKDEDILRANSAWLKKDVTLLFPMGIPSVSGQIDRIEISRIEEIGRPVVKAFYVLTKDGQSIRIPSHSIEQIRVAMLSLSDVEFMRQFPADRYPRMNIFRNRADLRKYGNQLPSMLNRDVLILYRWTGSFPAHEVSARHSAVRSMVIGKIEEISVKQGDVVYAVRQSPDQEPLEIEGADILQLRRYQAPEQIFLPHSIFSVAQTVVPMAKKMGVAEKIDWTDIEKIKTLVGHIETSDATEANLNGHNQTPYGLVGISVLATMTQISELKDLLANFTPPDGREVTVDILERVFRQVELTMKIMAIGDLLGVWKLISPYNLKEFQHLSDDQKSLEALKGKFFIVSEKTFSDVISGNDSQ